MEPRGRGRARGQFRQTPQQPQQTRPGSGHPNPQPRSQPQQRPGSQGQYPPPQQPTRDPLPPKPEGPPPTSSGQQMAGRGSRRGDEGGVHGRPEGHEGATEGEGEPCGAGSRGGASGNGGVRGRTPRPGERVTRPTTLLTKKGTSGQPLEVTANYFKLLQNGRWILKQYRVDFSVDIDDTPVKKRMMYQALREDNEISGYIFDGTVLYTPVRLSQETREYFVQDANDQPVRISMRFIAEVAWGDYHYLQVFNIIIRKCLVDLKLQLVGRNYFEPSCGVEMRDHNLVLWPGYFTSIKQHESDILMCSELQFKVMRLDTMLDCLNECRGANVRKEFTNKILGSVVLTAYNNKTYRVDDVDWSANPRSTFKRKDGSDISYMQYYEEKYGVRIRNDRQPMLVSRSKPREIRAGMPELVYLVPELCQMTGLTDRQRENFHLMRALAEYTRIGPQERMRRLQQFSNRLLRNKGAMEELKKWDVNIADQLVKFKARVLPPENICVGGEKKFAVGREADWTKDLRSSPMFIQGQMDRLAVIVPRKFCKPADDFMRLMIKAADGMRWSLSKYRMFEIDDDKIPNYLDKIEEVSQSNPTLIICIVYNNNSDKYSAIKKKCYVDKGIPSQVIVSKNLTSKGAMSIATKVAIQLNVKIGGSPWTVIMPLSNLMVVGYDVCRDTANRSQSFSGMVASMDKQITRYFSFAVEHKHEEELSDKFAAFILIACKKFKEHNKGNYPDRILIYRDGVGDGQIPYVYDHEVDLIKTKLKEELYKDRELKLAFVIVSKRVNTRIMYNENNPPPGTVVDDVITLPERYDFYIVSQCVRQGTVAPTSYNVIEDTMGLPPDRMQMLTYKLTHLYFNWSGTVRVPAPCQYAHKLAFLVAQNLHRTAHRRLENTLYYL